MGYSKYVAAIFVFWVVTRYIVGAKATSSQVIAPYCSEKCGNISIPYPFGIEDGCYFDSPFDFFSISCNESATPPVPIYGRNLEVLNISLDGEVRINRYISFDCYNNQNQPSGANEDWVHMRKFTVSSTKNILVGMGCDTYVWFSGVRDEKPYETGCMTSCNSLDDVVDGVCNGVGCCEASLPEGVTNMSTTIGSFWNHSKVPFNPCSAAFPVAIDAFRFNKRNLTQELDYYLDNVQLPVVFSWTVGTANCSVAQANQNFLCKDNTICVHPPNQVGYRCECKDGFAGNPYLPQGCTDIDECEESNECEKPEYCVNQIGGYYCNCPKGYHGNGTKSQPCVSNTKPWFIPVVATAGVAGVIILLLIVGFILYWKHGKRQLEQMRESYFRENGGLVLHQKLSGREVDALKVFTAQDLEIATQNYDDKYIIGRGGFGVVYKGILPNNQHVAIKRSIKVDPGQVEQFINEVLILSQINNRNVVRLLGCCLETQVPLLVYEFITNGTLYDHLSDAVKASILTWNIRLKIASEVASVLSYLHSTISTPIIHRDMKSMNILLDESYTAKVADFGASRLIPDDHDQLTTMVLGTWGYLDPEYMQSSELTEKSDVYSFGVVLAELLTRKKAISSDRPENERCLAMHLLVKMKEGHLLDILDKSIVSEGTIGQIQQVANLAKWCLMLKGEDRPTMKEVAIELETLKSNGSHPWNNEGGPIEDGESLLRGFPRSGTSGYYSSGIESSDLYDPRMVSTIDGGR